MSPYSLPAMTAATSPTAIARLLLSRTPIGIGWSCSTGPRPLGGRPEKDERVRVVRAPVHLTGVGAAKSLACELAQGNVLVELDHDDGLGPDCLNEVVSAFQAHPDAALVYSDFTQVNADGTPNPDRFDAGSGWVYTDERIGEHNLFALPCDGAVPAQRRLHLVCAEPRSCVQSVLVREGWGI